MNSRKTTSSQKFDSQRRELVARLRSRGSFDNSVLDAMLAVPRECFVDRRFEHIAYDDNALPIANGQTISQPTVVALMTTELRVTPDSKVLEIGTGSGYQAAVLAHLVRSVVSVERHRELASEARRTITALGIENVEVHAADGSKGWPQSAPYDRILVTAASPAIPQTLLSQLRPRSGSCLVVPVGDRDSQQLVRVEWFDGGWKQHSIGHVRFVPLRGEGGWSDSGWSEEWSAFPDDSPGKKP